MKKLALIIILLHTMISFSQNNNKTELQERVSQFSEEAIDRARQSKYYSKEEYKLIADLENNSFQNIAKPNENSELSLFLKENLNPQDLKKINYSKITSSFIFKTTPYKLENYDYSIILSFEINKDNKAQNIRIQTGDNDLNNQIKKTFKNFPLEKLKLNENYRSGIISVQLFTRENKKTIIKASTNAVYDVNPAFKECENVEYFNRRSSCFYNELNKYILKNISLEAISKQKLKGEITIYPRFSIDTNGKIYKVNSIAPNDIIKNEIDRIIESFNKTIIPAKRNGIPKEYYYETNYILLIENTK